MKTSILFLLIILIFENCSGPDVQNKQPSTDTATAQNVVTPPQSLTPTIRGKKYNFQDIFTRIAAFKDKFGKNYDYVPYASLIQDELFLIVIQGKWQIEYWNKNKKKVPYTYQVGLVNEQNNIIIPIEYHKIYNMGATAANLIEVEQDGKLGAYDITGKQLLKAEFDAIYPYKNETGVWAQVRKGKNFGWLSTDGSLQMDINSHEDKALFQTPSISKLIQNWNFDSESSTLIPILNTMDTDYYDENGLGLIVLPSYLYQLGIVPEFQHDWMFHPASFGNESTAATIQESKKTGKINTLMTTFNQSFMDARGYATAHHDVVTVNEQLEKIDVLPIEVNMEVQICSNEIKFKFVTDHILEITRTEATDYTAYELMTQSTYYKITSDGKIMPLDIKGDFKCTRVVKMTDQYFKGCYARFITDDELLDTQNGEEEEYFNYTKFAHLSIEDLDVMRNEIFAAHGYQFKNKKWQNYFQKKSWYQAQFEQVDDLLTDIEKHNIQVILDLKEKMKGNEEQFVKKTYEAVIAAG